MPTYISVIKLTREGKMDIKSAPERIDQARKVIEGLGGKMEIYATFGRYDYVAISEFPNDEAALNAIAKISTMGSVHIETLKAFSEEEFKKIVEK